MAELRKTCELAATNPLMVKGKVSVALDLLRITTVNLCPSGSLKAVTRRLPEVFATPRTDQPGSVKYE